MLASLHSLTCSDGKERRGNAIAWDWKRTTWGCCGVVTSLASQPLPYRGVGAGSRDYCGHVIMAAVGGTQSGHFDFNCSSAVRLSTDRTTAWTTRVFDFGMVFSKEPIPTGQKFSVKVLKPAVVSASSAYYTTPVRP